MVWWKVALFALAGVGLSAGPALRPAQAQADSCVVDRHIWAYSQRVTTRLRATPSATCSFGYGLRDGTGGGVKLKEVQVVQRPRQGRVEYLDTGLARFTYRTQARASGADSFVIRFVVDRLDQRSGVQSSSDWFEVHYTVRFAP
jgi:hypothetical protein